MVGTDRTCKIASFGLDRDRSDPANRAVRVDVKWASVGANLIHDLFFPSFV